jgi:four helix bundle protein
MTKIQITKQSNKEPYDLEERTFRFAKRCRDFVKKLPRTITNIEYGKQLVRASGSQAANYIEANEALSKKDFVHRIRISRKETKESYMWLRLCDTDGNETLEKERHELLDEAVELRKIFNSIYQKSV